VSGAERVLLTAGALTLAIVAGIGTAIMLGPRLRRDGQFVVG
jgi:hypothetical protein